MEIPFYGIKRFYKNHAHEILDVVHSVYAGGMMFGEEVTLLEKKLCDFAGRKYTVTVNSCTDALYFALKSAGIKDGDEVLLTSFSFIASASPILRAGAVPVFVDIDPATFLMDLADMQSKITKNTRAIIGVHLFGQPLNIAALEQIANKNNLFLIEDAAQGLGAKSGSRVAGSMGQVSCLSFDPTKIISAFGSGGAVLTNDEKIYKLINKLRYHGKGDTGDYEILGYNCRLSSSQCALINYQLRDHLHLRIERLREIANIYNAELGTINDLIIPALLPENYHYFHKYVIRTKYRDELYAFLNEKNVGTMIHYPMPLYANALFLNVPHKAENIKNCPAVCRDVLSLPIYPELTEQEIRYICDTIKSFYLNKC